MPAQIYKESDMIAFVLEKGTRCMWRIDGNVDMGAGRPTVGLLEKQMAKTWSEAVETA